MFPLEMDPSDELSPYFLSRLFFFRHSLSCNFFESLSSILSEKFEVIIHPLPLWSFLSLQLVSELGTPYALRLLV